MAAKIQKTNVARLLDSYHVNYDLIPYEVDESDLSAVHVAKLLDEPIELFLKRWFYAVIKLDFLFV